MTSRLQAVKAEFREVGTDTWLPASMPGSVHLDLMAAGVISDPFVADNELQVQWVANRDWVYKVVYEVTDLAVDDGRVYLVCEGLDTLADVSLNGILLGHAENMFREYRWDVTQLLKAGENEVRILFKSVIAHMTDAQKREPLIGVSQGIPGGAHVRKAPCQFGWDWGPQLPPIGIWKPMYLETVKVARFGDVHIRQVASDLPKDSAWDYYRVHVDVSVDAVTGAGPMQVTVDLTCPNGSILSEEAVVDSDTASLVFVLKGNNLEKWWPNGLGEQPLYGLDVKLMDGDAILDSRDYKIGLRTVELRQEKDEYGTSFTFVVNGVPIFAKGANWIPADSFPTRISDDDMEHLIRSAADSNMNMLRVWGGGLYEEDRFYDLCDKLRFARMAGLYLLMQRVSGIQGFYR